MLPAGNKAKIFSSVNHTTKTINHIHHLYVSINTGYIIKYMRQQQ